ncbi:MAG: hypothetical protein IPO09_12245 [Anaeromyxobacter sp.]|nr:hypothetical protein [Anaeromyxobacter sp.]MBL0276352.1 hypothetical protein [Anaeromyxobacter sp.]
MRRLALAALLLATACGKPLFYAEVEIPHASVKVPQQEFPSTQNPNPVDLCPDGASVPGNTCLQKLIEYDLGDDFRDLTKDATSLDLRLTELAIELLTTSALADFSSVERVRVTVQGFDQSQPPVELAAYTRVPGAPPATRIAVSARANVDIGAYLEGGIVRVNTLIEYDRDIPAFTADVTGLFYLRVVIDWWAASGL